MSIASDDLGGRAVRGASATIVGQLVRIGILLISTVVLSRILSPRDFGLLAIVLSILALGELIRDSGLSTAAARALALSHKQKSNLFWINSALGTAAALVTWLLAPLIAQLFGQPPLEGIVRAMSLVLVLGGLSTQFRAEINRDLRFSALAIVDTVPAAAGLIAALLFAVGDASYWVLVVQQLVTAAVGLVLAVAVARWWPGLPNRAGDVSGLVRYGLGLLGTQSVAYVTRNADNIALGYVWGPADLGIYSRAYQLLMLPITQLAAPLTRVAVPILTRVSDDRARFDRFLLLGQLVSGVGLGVFYAVAIGLADPLVRIVFGDGWLLMIPVFQVLAAGGIFRALNQVSYWAFLARDKTAAQFRFYLFSQPLIVVAMLAGLPWGPIGVAVGHSVGYAVNWMLTLWWCGRKTGIDSKSLARSAFLNLAIFVAPVVVLAWGVEYLVAEPLIAVAIGVVVVVAYLASVLTLVPHGRRVRQHLTRGLGILRRKGGVS